MTKPRIAIDGFLVNHYQEEGKRTYACRDDQGLDELIEHLTGRSADSFPKDARGLPQILHVQINTGLHIYLGDSQCQ